MDKSPSTYTVRRADWSVDGDALKAVRGEVFVIGQGVPPALELDGEDPRCWQIVAEQTGTQTAVGTGRMFPDGRIGRMAVLEAWRGRGIGAAILSALINQAHRAGLGEVTLHAQKSAVGFYDRHGFVPRGEEFLEAGIVHQAMHLTLKPDG